MPHIEQLSPFVANLIAAGEVVERPASVVKELLENAIDAGATAITVEIQNGGMTYLRVTDDGCGIAPEELPTAFLRHATSKLRTQQDLAAIGTLGFRGEALAAIAAVSRVDIFSRPRGASGGAALHLEGGAPGQVESAGCPEGTSIVVRDLFFNTPARLKFMKRDAAEATAINGLVAHLALSHPDISFQLIKDGKEELHTPGDAKLQSAIYAALGREFTRSLIPVRGSDGALSVEGFVTDPLNGRGTRGMQTFFVGGRLVKSQLLTAALEEAYANRMMKGKFPGCVLHVSLPFDMVDVNVHPAKTVVKFVNDKVIFDLVYHAVMDALDRGGAEKLPEEVKKISGRPNTEFFQSLNAAEFRARRESAPHAGGVAPAVKADPMAITSRSSELEGNVRVADYVPRHELKSRPCVSPTAQEAGGVFSRPNVAQQPRAAAPEQRQKETDAEQQVSLETEQQAPWRIAGEVLNTYIVCEDAEKNVWLIDKHAAHERINFDRLRTMQEPIMAQTLLTPIVAELGAAEYGALCEQLPLLQEFGFACEEFGTNSLILREIPADIDSGDAVAALEDLAGRLLAAHHADPQSARDAMLHTMACKAAIKGGWKSDLAELRILVEKVQSGEIKFCPHGRPVAAKLTKYELEKMFKRA